MSYTAYDPEYLNRDFDPSPLASATTSSQLSKSKKKPWSKFKSSISSLGKKMSAKPTFAEQTESSEQKRVKKSKKLKNNSAGDSTASSSQDNLREKSPSKGSKSLIKKLSVDSIATPFVGLQPSAVSSTKTYAKALTKSASTSESNLSTSDNDTPKKSLTLDKNTKYNLSSQESPDSGRVSQTMDGSRSSSQAGTQKEATSDLSVDSDYTSPQHSGVKQEVQLGSLVAKTEQLAQSLVPPKGKEKKLDVSFEFIKAETVVDPKLQARQVHKSGDGSKIENKSDSTKNGLESSNKDITENTPKPSEEKKSEPKADLNESSIDEAEGRKKSKDITVKKASTSSDFIASEQTKAAKDDPKKTEASAQKSYEKPSLDEKSEKAEDKTVAAKSEESEKKPVLAVKTDESKEKSVLDTKSEKDKENSSGDKSVTDAKKGALANLGKGLILEKIVEQPTPESKTPKADKPVPEVKTSESEKKTKNNSDEKESDPTNDDPSTITSQNDHETPSSSTEKVDEKLSEDGISSSSPPMDPLSIPDPLKNVGLPSDKDQKMSVDEKLEAFLSAEGWSGTIKDTAAKSSADGSQQPDKRECLYKILVIGELGTGKTSIIKRYVHQFFSQHYRATIGVDFALKVLNWDPNTIIRLQLWDIAGQERFGNMTRVYYKEAVGAFIVFDVTRSATFDAVLKWKQDLDSKVQLADGSPIPCVLLANKCDQQKEGVVNSPARMEEYCKDNNFSAWFETSAKENINIDEAAKSLVTQILQNDKMSQNGRDSARDGSQFPLENKSEDEGRSCAC